jgi:hypothetical protein
MGGACLVNGKGEKNLWREALRCFAFEGIAPLLEAEGTRRIPVGQAGDREPAQHDTFYVILRPRREAKNLRRKAPGGLGCGDASPLKVLLRCWEKRATE